MARREELLAAEEAGWERMHDLVRRLPPERMELPGDGADGWSVKDLLWHIACWSAEAGATFERIRWGTYDGGHEAWDATEELNARWLEQSRGLDLATVKAAWYASRTRMVETFGAFLDPSPDAIEWFEETGPKHYADHLEDLRGWVQRLRVPPDTGEMRGPGAGQP